MPVAGVSDEELLKRLSATNSEAFVAGGDGIGGCPGGGA